MKFLVSLVLFLSFSLVFPQDIALIDTLNLKYRNELSKMYTAKINKQQQHLNTEIPDKRIRKEVDAIYKESAVNFTKQTEKGVFIEEPSYKALLDGILEKIIKNNPDYPEIKNTKLLLSFGTAPNAYAKGNDIVVILVPLLKSIRNEHELAFIISHEIAHNLLNHSKKSIIEYVELKNSSEIRKQTREIERQKYNKAKNAVDIYKGLVYGKMKNSREVEHQADSLGFVLYKNAFKGYEYEAIKSLATLNEIDRENDSLSIADYSRFFSTEKHPFKKEWIENNELLGYNYDKNYRYWDIDSLKTHPDCDVRAEYLIKHFNVQESVLKNASDDFNYIKKSSSYNDILGLYVLEEYGKSLYYSLLSLKQDPESILLKKMIHNNLVKLQEAQKNYTLNRYLDNTNPKYSNSYNTFLYFIRQLRRSEMNSIINHYNI